MQNFDLPMFTWAGALIPEKPISRLPLSVIVVGLVVGAVLALAIVVQL